MDHPSARAFLLSVSVFTCVIMHVWETITEFHYSPESQEDTGLPEWFLPFLLLQWGAASVRTAPSFQSSFVDTLVDWYIKPRSSIQWWNHFVFYAREDDEQWREIFRLPYQLFQEVVDIVREYLQQKDIPEQLGRFPGRVFSVEKKVGIAVMLLASGNITLQTHLGVGDLLSQSFCTSLLDLFASMHQIVFVGLKLKQLFKR
ncbi:hypothetical protein L7F22_056684 [Adiantum nelumboides]|nr:hypothetical protein [Adiantum nelumboides]